jgi:hypothetical protein
MFTKNNDNTTSTRNNQTAQKSQKEKTMATGHTNSVADIDVTKPLTSEEQALVLRNNEEESSATSHFDAFSDYFPGKYSQNNFEKNLEKESFGYTNKNATIYDNPKTHKATGSISASTKVEILEVLKEYSKVIIIGSNSDTIWLSNADYSFTELGLGFVKHTALYNDIELYEAPFGEKKTIKLEAGKKYHLLKHCKNSKTNDQYSEVYPEKKRDLGREGLLPESDKPLGWVLNYEYVLSADNRRSREVAEYKKEVLSYLSEAYEKTGKERIVFVQGCLEKIWNKYKTAPNYVEPNPKETATVPHELIEPVRKLINIVERKSYADEAAKDNMEPNGWNYAIKEPEAEKTPVVGGSLHSDIDWNSKLGVPQYRTQSDNLTPPEATCGYTSMAMNLERLGNSRADVILAIDSKLKEGVKNPKLKSLWEMNVEAFLKKINSITTMDWQKVRYGNKGGKLLGKEKDLSKQFKKTAQMEDLIYFYKYLISSKSASRTDTFSTYKEKMPEYINNPEVSNLSPGAFNTDRDDFYGRDFLPKDREKMQSVLDNGGSVVMSVNHKGTEGSHIMFVQSINSQGLVIDDPYGNHAPDYKYGEKGDLFAGKGKEYKDRKKKPVKYMNEPHYNSADKDYKKRDFTAEKAQNLTTDESRGESVLVKWDYISKGFVYYIIYYEKN